MTREKAIEIIKSECYVFNPLNLDRSTMINKALDVAIGALEQDLMKIYNSGYSDGIAAYKAHMELCKEESEVE